ncbi:MAG: CRISPR-associated endonuclease Cas1 [Pirellulaceae bacterium]|jgi:CRISPR-associated protein Cas1|nr:CRISPR-associated endonuclease Cas1 [Thermoguttaceae bacterium]MDI9445234.1 CRISPR-associated endonuclease Cas1 [Planctomycetota bacterium]NLY99388.1 CRISPR-associated endonuclease Cas1 [Pirellulaceae bacterium]
MAIVAIAEQGTSVHAQGELLLVVREGRTIKRLRLSDVDQLLLYGRVELSSGAISVLARRNVDVVFSTLRGSFKARLSTRASKNVGLRLAQLRFADNPQSALEISRAIVVGKVTHQRQILLRAQRRLAAEEIAQALGQMRLLIHRAERENQIDSLRGLEGQAAALYFGNFGRLIRSAPFSFTGRNRRPPRDPVNAALSFGYALLTNTAETEVLRCGLDPMVGFFHQPAYGRPSLVLDLIEEFRPIVDSLVLRMINRRQLGPLDFQQQAGESLESLLAETSDGRESSAAGRPDGESGGAGAEDDPLQPPFDLAEAAAEAPTGEDGDGRPAVYLGDSGRRIVLSAFFRRMHERMHYGPRNENLELRQILREQIYHLARVIERKDADYLPFVPR